MLNNLIKKEKEKERLYNLVLSVVGVDVKEDNRKRKIVYSRIVFAQILIDNSHDPESIAIFLGRHRTNIYHYLKIFPTIYSQSDFAKNVYDEVFEKFYNGSTVNPLTDSREEILENELIKLKIENKKLTNELKGVKVEQNKDIDVERFLETFKAISLNVKKGREELMASKIYNTINTVNSSLVY
jgi:hypothetical protein